MHNREHHHHDHHHSSEANIGLAFLLNLLFTIIEFIGGWLTNSTAIMADAVHDLGDSLSLGFGWLLQRLSKRHADEQFSYGYSRFSLLGALINGAVLVAGSIWILSEAIPRLLNPQMPVAEGMLGLAVLGVVVNGWAAWSLSRGKTLNERVLNWHLLEDVLGWIAVLIVSIILLFVDWPILDPILSIAFTLFILFNVFRYLKRTLVIFLQAVPDKKLKQMIQQRLSEIDQVGDIHHLHLWSLDGEHHVMTAHLVLANHPDSEQQIELKQRIADLLSDLNLSHTTIEFELQQEVCRDE